MSRNPEEHGKLTNAQIGQKLAEQVKSTGTTDWFFDGDHTLFEHTIGGPGSKKTFAAFFRGEAHPLSDPNATSKKTNLPSFGSQGIKVSELKDPETQSYQKEFHTAEGVRFENPMSKDSQEIISSLFANLSREPNPVRIHIATMNRSEVIMELFKANGVLNYVTSIEAVDGIYAAKNGFLGKAAPLEGPWRSGLFNKISETSTYQKQPGYLTEEKSNSITEALGLLAEQNKEGEVISPIMVDDSFETRDSGFHLRNAAEGIKGVEPLQGLKLLPVNEEQEVVRGTLPIFSKNNLRSLTRMAKDGIEIFPYETENGTHVTSLKEARGGVASQPQETARKSGARFSPQEMQDLINKMSEVHDDGELYDEVEAGDLELAGTRGPAVQKHDDDLSEDPAKIIANMRSTKNEPHYVNIGNLGGTTDTDTVTVGRAPVTNQTLETATAGPTTVRSSTQNDDALTTKMAAALRTLNKAVRSPNETIDTARMRWDLSNLQEEIKNRDYNGQNGPSARFGGEITKTNTSSENIINSFAKELATIITELGNRVTDLDKSKVRAAAGATKISLSKSKNKNRRDAVANLFENIKNGGEIDGIRLRDLSESAVGENRSQVVVNGGFGNDQPVYGNVDNDSASPTTQQQGWGDNYATLDLSRLTPAPSKANNNEVLYSAVGTTQEEAQKNAAANAEVLYDVIDHGQRRGGASRSSATVHSSKEDGVLYAATTTSTLDHQAKIAAANERTTAANNKRAEERAAADDAALAAFQQDPVPTGRNGILKGPGGYLTPTTETKRKDNKPPHAAPEEIPLTIDKEGTFAKSKSTWSLVKKGQTAGEYNLQKITEKGEILIFGEFNVDVSKLNLSEERPIFLSSLSRVEKTRDSTLTLLKEDYTPVNCKGQRHEKAIPAASPRNATAETPFEGNKITHAGEVRLGSALEKGGHGASSPQQAG